MLKHVDTKRIDIVQRISNFVFIDTVYSPFQIRDLLWIFSKMKKFLIIYIASNSTVEAVKPNKQALKKTPEHDNVNRLKSL